MPDSSRIPRVETFAMPEFLVHGIECVEESSGLLRFRFFSLRRPLLDGDPVPVRTPAVTLVAPVWAARRAVMQAVAAIEQANEAGSEHIH